MKDIINENQNNLFTDKILLFLQEKRTALAYIRIGISTIIAQISILGVMIVTSKYYSYIEVMHLLIPFVVLNIMVLCVAVYFIVRPLIQLHRLDREILKYKRIRNDDAMNISQ
jgi:hypothetical protein